MGGCLTKEAKTSDAAEANTVSAPPAIACAAVTFKPSPCTCLDAGERVAPRPLDSPVSKLLAGCPECLDPLDTRSFSKSLHVRRFGFLASTALSGLAWLGTESRAWRMLSVEQQCI
jgi:hypothetical protein